MDTGERSVPDELWDLFQRVVPEPAVRPQGGRRRRAGDRQVPAAIVFVTSTGGSRRRLPPVSGAPWQSAHRRFTAWTAARVWAKLYHVVPDELGAGGELDRSRAAIDPASIHALTKGPPTGPNPTDHGEKESKIHLIYDRNATPLAVGPCGANLHDGQALEPLLAPIPPTRSRRGPRRRRPAKPHADTAHDRPFTRRLLREHGITARIARPGVDSSQHPGTPPPGRRTHDHVAGRLPPAQPAPRALRAQSLTAQLPGIRAARSARNPSSSDRSAPGTT
ncbi:MULTISPECIES: IS5 family transposase [unclassified Kitasatospora]|uniref:IS5 family transposase n=1 Tax=unclassified Kitasatospora TaxID=2633591 RepID=UPI0033C91EEB